MGVGLHSIYLLFRGEKYTCVYTIVYTRVYNSVPTCTQPRSRYVLCGALL